MTNAPLALPEGASCGYLGPAYAAALSEFGAPAELPLSGGWILTREVPGGGARDGMGCYPYLVCRDWRRLGEDLRALASDLVCVAAAPDPFADCPPEALQAAFPDLMIAFKSHHVADLSRPLGEIVSTRYRRYADKALTALSIEFHPRPSGFLDAWTPLFGLSIQRFGLKGVRAFSRQSFARQLAIPGCVLALAKQGEEVVAAHLWMTHGEVAYAHLAAPGPRANELRAAYALYYAELQYFAGKVGWIDWGGEAGLSAAGALGTFKRGWSTGERTAYFCGRIFDPERYDQLRRAAGKVASRYFPAYREGEFA